MLRILYNRPINVVVIGNNQPLIRLIKKQFQEITAVWHIWSCYDLDELADFTLLEHEEIDLVLFDLTELNEEEPKTAFMRLAQKLKDVPIIALIDEKNDDLISFVMDKGAADNISQWQIKSDPANLINMIKSCLVRDDIAKNKHAISEDGLLESKTRYQSLLREVHTRRAQYMHSQQEQENNINVLTDEVKVLREENDKLIHALHDVLGKFWSEEVLGSLWSENDRMDNEGAPDANKK